MNSPNLKRIKLSSAEALRVWLAKALKDAGPVMLVTCDASSPTKYVPPTEITSALADHGWRMERAYTLSGGLMGRVVRAE